MTKLFYLLIITLIASSCVSTKKLAYFQSDKFSENSPTLIENKRPVYKIQPNDILAIRVYNLIDKTTPNIFEQDGSVGGNVNPAASFYINGYSVDEKGFINFPTIGKLKVNELTTNEV